MTPHYDMTHLLAADWAGATDPFKTAMVRLVDMDRGTRTGLGFVVDMLDLWLRCAGPNLNIKYGGAKAANHVILPVVTWWLDGAEGLPAIHPKYRPAANALIAKMESVSWQVLKDASVMQSIDQ